MSERNVEVFFYGLFMDIDALRQKGLHPTHPRRAVVGDMALRIGARATLAHCSGNVAYGIVMTLPEREVSELYSDPSVSAYKPETVVAICEDETAVSAGCYNLPDGATGGPNPEYAAKLAVVAQNAGLPDSYIRTLRHMCVEV